MSQHEDDETVNEIGPLWSELYGGLWHTTSEQRLHEVLASGAILPEPPGLLDSERWKASRGPDLYPVARFLGGISLFDWCNFEPAQYDEEYPLSTWREFVPYRQKWGSAAWIEIDRNRIGSGYISAPNLLSRWKSESLYRHTIMPMIEAAHIGPIPVAAFRRILIAGPGKDRLAQVDIEDLRQ